MADELPLCVGFMDIEPFPTCVLAALQSSVLTRW